MGLSESVTDRARHSYLIDLDGWIISGTDPAARETIGAPAPTIDEGWPSLMLDAYVGTIDYDGENLDDARAEIEEYFSSEPMLDCSRVVESRRGWLAAATLVYVWEGSPSGRLCDDSILAQGPRAGPAGIGISLDCLARTSNRQVYAFITEGNTASERLFASLGAVPGRLTSAPITGRSSRALQLPDHARSLTLTGRARPERE